MSSFTIGQLARAAHVHVETIRYYERLGLLREPTRLPSGYRSYAPDDVRRVQFIRYAQQLGFSLQEVGELLRLRVDPGMSCREVRQHAEAKIADIERKIENFTTMREALVTLSGACHADESAGCQFLDALDRHSRDRVPVVDD